MIVVCDGVFQVQPAVSHGELCAAIDAGWQIWGVSSIGAIRAYEMRDIGMRGFGYVHRLFHDIPGLSDDEVCLLHFPEPPYFPVTEALVNLRFALERKRHDFDISDESAARVIDTLSTRWFGARDEETMRRLICEIVGIPQTTAERFLGWLKSNRVKTLDLAQMLSERPWLAAQK